MTIGTLKSDDGVFNREVPYIKNPGAGELQQFSEFLHAARAEAIATWPQEMRRAAETVIAKEESAPALESDPNQAADARALRACLDQMEKAAAQRGKEGKRLLAYNAMLAGRYYERIMVRIHSPHLKRGVQVLKGARLGHDSTHGTKTTKEAAWAKYSTAYDQLRQEKPHLSKSACYRHVGNRFAVSAKTVQRAVMRRNKKS